MEKAPGKPAEKPPERPPEKPVAPRLLAISPAEGTLLRGDIEVAGTLEGSVARVVVNGVPMTPEGGAFRGKIAGAKRVLVVGLDAAGARLFERTISVRLDNDPPRILLETPLRAVTREASATIAGSVTDENPGAAVEVGGALFPLASGAFRADRPLSRGENRIKVLARDQVGNEAETQITVIQDRDPPEVSIDAPPDGLLTREGKVEVRGEARDETGVAAVLVNGKEAALERGRSYRTEVLLAENEKTAIEVRARDEAGNLSAPRSVMVTSDRRAPEIRLDALPARLSGPRVELTGSVDEDGCTVGVDGLSAIVTGRRFRGEVLLDRARQVELTARDPAGNTGRLVVALAPTPPSPPPVAGGPSSGEGGAGAGAGASSGGGAATPPTGGGGGEAPASNPFAPGSLASPEGILGTVERVDREFGKVVFALARGAKVSKGDLLDVVRGAGIGNKVGRIRVTLVRPDKASFSAEDERGTSVERYRSGDRAVIPAG
jgi:hypothetical protein